jgi:hypothetical protein
MSNTTMPTDLTDLVPALVQQLIALFPTHYIFATFALIIISILVSAGSWVHLAQLLQAVCPTCTAAEEAGAPSAKVPATAGKSL